MKKNVSSYMNYRIICTVFLDLRNGQKKMLEIGCGAGIDSIEFTRNDAIVTETNLRYNALKLTRALSEETGSIMM